MQRREFITLLGGAAVAWPRAAHADRMRRVGVLEARTADDREGQARLAAVLQGLQELGWTDGRNVRIDHRWAAADADEIERDIAAFAREANGGLIVTASSGAVARRELIIMLAARHRLPAVYPFRYFVTSGGLISYGPDPTDQFRASGGLRATA